VKVVVDVSNHEQQKQRANNTDAVWWIWITYDRNNNHNNHNIFIIIIIIRFACRDSRLTRRRGRGIYGKTVAVARVEDQNTAHSLAYTYDTITIAAARIPISNVIMINDTGVPYACTYYVVLVLENTAPARRWSVIFIILILSIRRRNAIIIICNIDCCGMMPRARRAVS
jgi:hypothetical protein